MAPVLVTGARGQLGHDVVIALADAGYRVEATGRDSADVTDPRATMDLMRLLRPRAVVDCAESWPPRGARAEAVAAAAARVGAFSIYVSCADVFDGRLTRPYVESDPPAPPLPFGRAKLSGERAVARVNPRHAIVRTGWLFGAHHRCFVDDLLDQARDGAEVLVDGVLRSTPTFTGHLADALVRLVRRPGYGVFHAAADSRGATMLQFTRALFGAMGVDAEPVAASSTGRAEFPAQLVLGTRRANAMRIPDWRLGVSAYVAARAQREAPQPPRDDGEDSEVHGPESAAPDGTSPPSNVRSLLEAPGGDDRAIART